MGSTTGNSYKDQATQTTPTQTSSPLVPALYCINHILRSNPIHETTSTKIAISVGHEIGSVAKVVGQGPFAVANGLGEGIIAVANGLGEGTVSVANDLGEGVKGVVKSAKQVGGFGKSVFGTLFPNKATLRARRINNLIKACDFYCYALEQNKIENKHYNKILNSSSPSICALNFVNINKDISDKRLIKALEDFQYSFLAASIYASNLTHDSIRSAQDTVAHAHANDVLEKANPEMRSEAASKVDRAKAALAEANAAFETNRIVREISAQFPTHCPMPSADGG
jgi:hypothetical protein